MLKCGADTELSLRLEKSHTFGGAAAAGKKVPSRLVCGPLRGDGIGRMAK